MALVTPALWLAQISAFATIKMAYSCMEYKSGRCHTPRGVANLLIFKSVPSYSWLATSEHWGHFQYADRDRGLVAALSMYAVSSENCGNQPTVSNDNGTLYWDRGASNSTLAYLDIRRVDNAWNQKGCFSQGYSLIAIYVPASSSYAIPSYNVDYDSLYVVRMYWYLQARYFYDSDCYFTLQPSEYIVVTIQCICCRTNMQYLTKLEDAHILLYSINQSFKCTIPTATRTPYGLMQYTIHYFLFYLGYVMYLAKLVCYLT